MAAQISPMTASWTTAAVVVDGNGSWGYLPRLGRIRSGGCQASQIATERHKKGWTEETRSKNVRILSAARAQGNAQGCIPFSAPPVLKIMQLSSRAVAAVEWGGEVVDSGSRDLEFGAGGRAGILRNYAGVRLRNGCAGH